MASKYPSPVPFDVLVNSAIVGFSFTSQTNPLLVISLPPSYVIKELIDIVLSLMPFIVVDPITPLPAQIAKHSLWLENSPMVVGEQSGQLYLNKLFWFLVGVGVGVVVVDGDKPVVGVIDGVTLIVGVIVLVGVSEIVGISGQDKLNAHPYPELVEYTLTVNKLVEVVL